MVIKKNQTLIVFFTLRRKIKTKLLYSQLIIKEKKAKKQFR